MPSVTIVPPAPQPVHPPVPQAWVAKGSGLSLPPTRHPYSPPEHALARKYPEVALEAAQLRKNSKKDSTWRKYELQFGHFEAWCLKEGLSALPADPYTVMFYLTIIASTKQSTSTVNGAKSAIACFHKCKNYDDPTKHDEVLELTTGVANKYGQQPNKSKE